MYKLLNEMLEGISKDMSDKSGDFEFSYRGKTYNMGGYDLCGEMQFYVETTDNVGHIYESMGVKKITTQYITLFSYDMMKQRTQYKMNINEIAILRVAL